MNYCYLLFLLALCSCEPYESRYETQSNTPYEYLPETELYESLEPLETKERDIFETLLETPIKSTLSSECHISRHLRKVTREKELEQIPIVPRILELKTEVKKLVKSIENLEQKDKLTQSEVTKYKLRIKKILEEVLPKHIVHDTRVKKLLSLLKHVTKCSKLESILVETVKKVSHRERRHIAKTMRKLAIVYDELCLISEELNVDKTICKKPVQVTRKMSPEKVAQKIEQIAFTVSKLTSKTLSTSANIALTVYRAKQEEQNTIKRRVSQIAQEHELTENESQAMLCTATKVQKSLKNKIDRAIEESNLTHQFRTISSSLQSSQSQQELSSALSKSSSSGSEWYNVLESLMQSTTPSAMSHSVSIAVQTCSSRNQVASKIKQVLASLSKQELIRLTRPQSLKHLSDCKTTQSCVDAIYESNARFLTN